MKRFIIITSYIEGTPLSTFKFEPDDCIICADGGFHHAQCAGITPNLVIGDFDSFFHHPPKNIEFIKLPTEKDDTDTGACIQYALSNGAEELVIIGGIGGRLDHTIGNLQLINSVVMQGKKITLIDEKNMVTMLKNGSITIPRLDGYRLSLLSYSEDCFGVNIKGVFYPLKDAHLSNFYPIGVSNEFIEDFAEISVSQGTLLIILSRD